VGRFQCTQAISQMRSGLCSLWRTGCAWRYLLRDDGPWSWVHAELREVVREWVGRASTPCHTARLQAPCKTWYHFEGCCTRRFLPLRRPLMKPRMLMITTAKAVATPA
jgi:transposase